MTGRAAAIGDAGIAVLAAQGSRGLTHRAVDAAAGLPPGSTSYYFRTRDALLGAVVERLAELDMAGTPPAVPRSVDDLADLLADLVTAQCTTFLERTLARYQLVLEARRRPAVREALGRGRRQFTEAATALVRAVGSSAPDRHGPALVAICDGLLFDAVAGSGCTDPPDPAEVRGTLRDVLRGMTGA